MQAMLKDTWSDPRRRGDVLWIALLIVLAVGGLSLTFAHDVVAGLLMFGVLGTALWRWHDPQDFLLAISGFFIGPTMEMFATSTGLWKYPYPTIGALPLWVFALWPTFPICLVRLTHALLPPRGPRPSALAELALGAAIVVL